MNRFSGRREQHRVRRLEFAPWDSTSAPCPCFWLLTPLDDEGRAHSFSELMAIGLVKAALDAPMQSHTQKVVMLALAYHANENKVCWPSVRLLAKECEMSQRSVRYQLRALVKQRYLRVEHREGHSSHYHLRLTPAPVADPTPARLASTPARLAARKVKET